MSNFFNLVKVQFLSFFGINKLLYSKKKKKVQGLSGLILLGVFFVLLLGGLSFYYSYIFSNFLAVVPLMFSMSAMVNLFFSFYASSGTIYGFKDYQLLASMPIKPRTIVASKLFFMYIGNLMLSIIIVAFACVADAIFVAPLNAYGYIRLTIMLLFSPCLPIAVSLVIGVVISYVSSHFIKKNIIELIMYFIVFVGAFVISFLSTDSSVQPLSVINKIYFCSIFVVNGIYGWLDVLYFVLVNALPCALICVVVIKTYKKMNSILTCTKKVKKFKLASYIAKGQKQALFKREMQRLFSCSIYALNNLGGTVLGMITMIAMAILFSITKIGYVEEIAKIVPLVLTFTFTLTPTTCCSISIEGQTFWQLKTAPISMRVLILTKLSINFIFATVPALFCTLFFTVLTGMPYYMVIMLCVFAVTITLFGGGIGMLWNLIVPMMKWENPKQPVKSSGASGLTVLTNFIVTAILVLSGFFIPLSAPIIIAIMTLFSITICIIVNIIILKKGEKLIAKRT